MHTSRHAAAHGHCQAGESNSPGPLPALLPDAHQVTFVFACMEYFRARNPPRAHRLRSLEFHPVVPAMESQAVMSTCQLIMYLIMQAFRVAV
eukprot:scaffold99168_cov21-Tisochrysis_lutea.AAC.2